MSLSLLLTLFFLFVPNKVRSENCTDNSNCSSGAAFCLNGVCRLRQCACNCGGGTPNFFCVLNNHQCFCTDHPGGLGNNTAIACTLGVQASDSCTLSYTNRCQVSFSCSTGVCLYGPLLCDPFNGDCNNASLPICGATPAPTTIAPTQVPTPEPTTLSPSRVPTQEPTTTLAPTSIPTSHAPITSEPTNTLNPTSQSPIGPTQPSENPQNLFFLIVAPVVIGVSILSYCIFLFVARRRELVAARARQLNATLYIKSGDRLFNPPFWS